MFSGDRFQEGEFRKRVQFIYGGELRTVRFRYSGLSIETVPDRLPTAKVLEERAGVYTVDGFGDGMDMWLRSKTKPVRLRDNKVNDSAVAGPYLGRALAWIEATKKRY